MKYMYFPRVVKIFEGYNHDSLYSGAKLCLSIRGRVKPRRAERGWGVVRCVMSPEL